MHSNWVTRLIEPVWKTDICDIAYKILHSNWFNTYLKEKREMIKLLIDGGADINAVQENTNETALIRALSRSFGVKCKHKTFWWAY